MEELNTAPNTPEQEDTSPYSSFFDSLEEKLDKPFSRRKFLGGALAVVGGLALSSCNTKILEAAEGGDPFKKNKEDLAQAFESRKFEFLNDNRTFNYERFSEQYPGFDSYAGIIEDTAIEVSREYDVDSNALRALTCSIVASNMNNQDPINPDTDQFTQRFGVMQVFPINLIETKSIRDDPKLPSSVQDFSNPGVSIKFGMKYLVEGLKEFRNDGENTDIMQLALAQYYGKSSLLDQIKHNREIKEDSYLWSNYMKYLNTLKVLGTPKAIPEVTEAQESHSMEQVWSKIKELWSGSRFEENKDVFFLQAQSYFGDKANERLKIKPEQYLALFASIARVESRGGIHLYNEDSGASGWFQLVPTAKHLEDFNTKFGTNYKYEDLRNVNKVDKHDPASIIAGIWGLMRYRNTIDELKEVAYKHDPDMHVLMKFFKAGRLFEENRDDALWWNRVSYGINSLLGYNPFDMEYKDYFAPRKVYDENGKVIYTVWKGPFEASKFEEFGDYEIMGQDPKVA